MAKWSEGKAVTEWVRSVNRTGTLPLSWVHGVLGEADPKTARDEAAGLLGRRLAEDLRRLRRRPPEVLAVEVLAGRHDYHKVQAKQALQRGQRSQGDRWAPLERPERIPDATAPHESQEAAEQPNTVAAAVIRHFQLRPAQAKVVRFITANPGAHTQKEIAQGAGVSLSTVEGTLRNLAGDQAKLRRIFSPR